MPTFITEAEVSNWGWVGVASKTTATFNAKAGDTLVAVGIGLTGSTTEMPMTIADSNGLTWTQRVENTDGTTGYCYVSIWTADTPSDITAGTVTFTKKTATSWPFGGLCQIWRGVDSTGAERTNRSSGVPPLSETLTTTARNSAILQASADWNANNTQPTWLSDSDSSDPVQTFFVWTDGTGYMAASALNKYVGPVAAVALGNDAPFNQKFTYAAIELLSTVPKTITKRTGESISTGTSSVVATVPAAAVAGDVLLFYAVTNSGATPSPPAGWELITQQANGTSVSGYIFGRVSDGTEGGTNVTLSGLNTKSAGFIQAWANCDVGVPLVGNGASWLSEKSSRVNASGVKGSTSVTPDRDNCMIILSDHVLAGTTHNTWLDGNSNAMTEGGADGGDGTVSICNAYLLQTTLVATGVGTWSQPNNGAGVGMWLTLMPALEVGTVVYPDITAELWEAGSLVASLGTVQVAAEGVLEFTWDAATLANITGADVELRLTTTESADYDAIEWEAYYEESQATSIESWGMALM